MSQSEAAGHYESRHNTQAANCVPNTSIGNNFNYSYSAPRLKKKTTVKDYENGKVVKETITEEWEPGSWGPYWYGSPYTYGSTTINTTNSYPPPKVR